ncbi:VOC family protein [Streptomyces litchfieldiae]|uniref:VOC family protein n=1 Tax=Streptomyces litchfieldiae TaxID=3075543 RepID=A0ABU2MQ19_9ACTN|nr:VOC family protein [Streptomyces sp. DSM 44938]MDT0343605.1 VOC family protein [Streptomyces sp. DSM 44938]
MRIDHVIIGSRTLVEIRDLLRDTHGFGLVEGSAHEDGTKGWLVPFDSPDVQYLEVLVPGDQRQLTADAFGTYFLEATADGPAFLGWAVHTEEIEKDAARVAELTGADPKLLQGESVRADGRRFPWAEAAFELAWRSPSRPFFLRYGNTEARRERVPGDLVRAGHRTTPLAYAGIAVGTAGLDLAAWCGGHELPVTQRPSTRECVEAVRITTGAGTTTLELPC